jgi:large subunit ribosomal protein L9
MKVILSKDVPNLGDAGDSKEVSSGYARNFLFPKKLALRINEGSAKTAAYQKKLSELKKEKKKKEIKEVLKALEGKVVEIPVRVGENDKLFGSVTSIDIAVALEKMGFSIEKRKIEVAEHIKALGSYKAKVKFSDGMNASIEVKVVQAS